jgi:hypothetical protein
VLPAKPISDARAGRPRGLHGVRFARVPNLHSEFLIDMPYSVNFSGEAANCANHSGFRKRGKTERDN